MRNVGETALNVELAISKTEVSSWRSIHRVVPDGVEQLNSVVVIVILCPAVRSAERATPSPSSDTRSKVQPSRVALPEVTEMREALIGVTEEEEVSFGVKVTDESCRAPVDTAMTLEEVSDCVAEGTRKVMHSMVTSAPSTVKRGFDAPNQSRDLETDTGDSVESSAFIVNVPSVNVCAVFSALCTPELIIATFVVG